MEITKRWSFLVVSVVVALFLVGAARGADKDRRLVILFTHDLHSYFLPQRVEQPDGSFAVEGGYARLATAVERQRERHGDAVLLVDAGDYSMGTLFHSGFMSESWELRLMAAMGYDAVTLGNHEFDFKPEGLAKSLARAREILVSPPPIVASNVVFTADDPGDRSLKEEFRRYPVHDYLVIEKGGIRVGIFGILGKKAMVDAPFASPVTFSDPMEEGRRVVDILRNREGVDLVVCLSHTGTSEEKKLSEDERIAGEVPGIDVLVSGHTHTLLEEPIVVGRTHIVSAGNYGRHLGILEMSVEAGGGPRMVSYEIQKTAFHVPEGEAAAATIEYIKERIDEELLAPLGLSFDQVVAVTDFSLKIPANVSENPGELGLGNLVTDSYRYAIRRAEAENYEHVTLAVQPIGHIRDSIIRGPVTVDDVFRVLSLGIGPDNRVGYPLLTGYLTGGELKKLMEVETTIRQMKPEAQLQVSGVKMTYNPYRVPFDRVTSLFVENERGDYVPVERDRLYRIAANLYTAYMVDYISDVSFGLLSMELKDRNGKPLERLTDGIVSGTGSKGGGEVKEWLSLLSFLESFPDRTGDGLPDIPFSYASPEGRILVEPSWNPLKLVQGSTMITWVVIAVLLVILAIPVLFVTLIRRRRRRRRRQVGLHIPIGR